MFKIFIVIAVLTVFFSLPYAAHGGQAGEKPNDGDHAIAFLIEAIENSQLAFIRNGETHSGTEAAEHVRTKYVYFKFRIKTPEDFIRLCATKSLVSGKPYLVVTPQGTVTAESWLKQLLAEYRRAQADK